MPTEQKIQSAERYSGPLLDVRAAGDDMTLGTWWWDVNLLVRPEKQTGLTAETALDMLKQNHVTEIYLSVNPAQLPDGGQKAPEGKVTKEQLAQFIQRCHDAGIRVAALASDGGISALTWIDEGWNYIETTSFVDAVSAYNRDVPPSQRFYGIHLDLEPDMKGDLLKYRSWMRRYVLFTRRLCDKDALQLEMDLSAFINDSHEAMDEKGQMVKLADVYTTQCDAVTLMAYRPNAKDQLDTCTYLVDAAQKNNCHVNIGCETCPAAGLGDEAFITYENVGPLVLGEEQRKLRAMMEKRKLPAGFGISVHWVNTWYQLNIGQFIHSNKK